jgi:hypothetical protein
MLSLGVSGGSKTHCPDALDLAEAATGQLCGLFDSLAAGAQRDDAVVGSGIWAASGAFGVCSRNGNLSTFRKTQPYQINA